MFFAFFPGMILLDSGRFFDFNLNSEFILDLIVHACKDRIVPACKAGFLNIVFSLFIWQ